MKLLTGSTGMIGMNLKELLPPMLTPTRDELDLTNKDKVKEYLRANKPEAIIHCASNDDEDCLFDNLRMFNNLAESGIPMIIFCTGREIEDRSYKNGQYVLSKHITKELALYRYHHIAVIQIWGCFGKYERPIRFFAENIARIKQGLPIIVREDKLFSYVYVKDLAKIINEMDIVTHCRRVVGYTKTLREYAHALAKITGAPCIIEKSNFCHSYVGENDLAGFEFTPIEEAIKELLI